MNNGNTTKIIQIIITALLIISIGLNIYLLTKENRYKTVEKIKTEIIRDTIHDTIPQVKYEKFISYNRDTLRLVDSIPGDTTYIVAEIPITQKTYSDDSTYTAFVSGYKQKLDSINVYRKTVYTTREITKTKKQKIIFGPQVGYSYDFNSKKLSPTIGVGVTYNMFGF